MFRFFLFFVFVTFSSFSAAVAQWSFFGSYNAAGNEGEAQSRCVAIGAYYVSQGISVKGEEVNNSHNCYFWDDDGTGSQPCTGSSVWSNVGGACSAPAPSTTTGVSNSNSPYAKHSPSAVSSTNPNGFIPENVIDPEGNVWQPDLNTVVCASNGLCKSSYNKMPASPVNPNQPSTWPEYSVPSSGSPNSPNGYSPETGIDYETDPFANPDAPEVVDLPSPFISDDTTSSSSRPDGTEELGERRVVVNPDGDIVDTDKKTIISGDGSKKEVITVRTTDKQTGRVTETETTKTYDGNGDLTGTSITGSSSSSAGLADEDEQAQPQVSGGGSCEAAPFCEGDAVGCALLLQSYNDRCNSDYSSGEIGGNCSSTFQCEGDPIACAINQQKHDELCAIQAEFTSEAIGDAMDRGLDDLEDGLGGSVLDDDGLLKDVGDEVDVGESFNLSSIFDQSGGGGSCPEPQNLSLSFGSYELEYDPFCELAESLSSLVVLIFSFIGGRIIFNSLQS